MSRAGFRMMCEKDYSNPLEWEERLFFPALSNRVLEELTESRFTDAKRPLGSHPVYLLRRIERGCYQCCPCSSRDFNRDKASYIRKNARTTPHGFRIERDSYILHFYSFNLGCNNPLTERLPLLGRVNEADIEGSFHIGRNSR